VEALATKGWRAVVVEEWRVLRSGLGSVLRRDGLAVLGEAAAIDDVLGLCERAELLVIGGSDPTRVAQMVRTAKAACPDVRIVALLGAIAPGPVVDTFAAGADAVVSREVTDDELREALRRLALNQRYIAGAPTPSLFAAVGEASGGPSVLTGKEREVLVSLARGASNREIAADLYVSPSTVKTHLSNIYAKLDAANRHQAVRRAMDLGLLA
jgi:DNA-binding NarL/FixJ family response regulator